MPPPQAHASPARPHRWARFALVGLAGVAVQVGTLVVLADRLAVNLPTATVAAVLAAVVHNFCWHRRWTWADRTAAPALRTFLGFAGANGVVSVVGNAAVVTLLVDRVGLPTPAAALVAIGACAWLNYTLADRLVFVAADKADRV